MEPRQYVAILVRRWVILTAAAVAGIIGSGVITLLTPATYTSSASVLFTAEQGTRAAEALQGEQYAEASVASFVDLARTPAVLGPVIDALSLPLTTAQLRDAVRVQVLPDTTVIEISATMSSADDAVGVAAALTRQLRVALADLAPGAGTSGLTVTEVSPAQRPQAQSAPNGRQNLVAGAGLGLILGVAAACILEARRPRLAGRRDLESLTDLPIWEFPQLAGRSQAGREPQGRMDRLSLLIGSGSELADVVSISGDSGAGRPGVAGALARSLAASLDGRSQPAEFLPAAAPQGNKHLGVIDLHQRGDAERGEVAVLTTQRLLVVEPGRTSRRELQGALTGPARSGHLLALVLAPRHDESAGLRRVFRRLADPDPSPARGGLCLGPDGAPVAVSTGITALAAVGLAGMSYPLPLGTNTAFIASVALAPIWLRVLSSYRYARLLLGLAVAALVAGFLLADLSSADRAFDGRIAAETSFRFLGAFATIGLVLWTNRFFSVAPIGIAYGTGALLTGLTQVSSSPNPWKYELAFGVTVALLGLVFLRKHRMSSITALLMLGSISILLDSRSWFAFCALAAVLLGWQARPSRLRRMVGQRALTLLGLVSVALGGFFLTQYALLEGYLGDDAQRRTIEQIDQSGSLIAGGRPEWTVTRELMLESPLGNGIGIVPTSADILAGQRGFATVNADFQIRYVEYLFGGQFKLHSVIADMWSNFGVTGIALSLLLAYIFVRTLVQQLSIRQLDPLCAFLIVDGIWILVFEPIYSSLPSLALAAGLALGTWANPEIGDPR